MPFTLWIPTQEQKDYLVKHYENTGIKTLPKVVFHFEDGHIEQISNLNPRPWLKNWKLMIKTLNFKNLESYHTFHATPLIINMIEEERQFYIPQGVTFVRNYSGE